MNANLNPTFKKELKYKKIKVDFQGTFTLTPYELNQIRYWLNCKQNKNYNLPAILPVSKRFVLDFLGWEDENYNDVLLCKFNKGFFRN